MSPAHHAGQRSVNRAQGADSVVCVTQSADPTAPLVRLPTPTSQAGQLGEPPATFLGVALSGPYTEADLSQGLPVWDPGSDRRHADSRTTSMPDHRSRLRAQGRRALMDRDCRKRLSHTLRCKLPGIVSGTRLYRRR